MTTTINKKQKVVGNSHRLLLLFVVVALVLCLFECAIDTSTAFVVVSPATVQTTAVGTPSITSFNPIISKKISFTELNAVKKTSTKKGKAGTALSATKSKNKKGDTTTTTTMEKKNALELVVLYMTPWRNPNSIFVYMFLTLYALGKYSESHPPGAGGGPM